MGTSSGGVLAIMTSKKKYTSFRSRQRANMSFFIVVMFFAVFGMIVFTEIFLIDERGRGAGVLVRHGSLMYQQKHYERSDYEDGVQNDDYISLRIGAAMLNDETVGALLVAGGSLPVVEQAPAAPQQSSNFNNKVLKESQLPQYPEHLVPQDGAWQNINGTHFKFFVFSSFLDNRKNQRAIRVIAATKTRGPERVWCRLWFNKKTNESANSSSIYYSQTILAKIKVIRENWNLKYSACFVLCPITPNQSIPSAVSIVSKVRDVPTNLLLVNNNNNFNLNSNKKRFGVCIKPLHFDFNREMQILEFIEFNKLLGVEHFTFYNHTIGHQVNCILQDYIKEGLVTLKPWNLNMVSQKEIRTEGIFAAINDCLYRSMYKFSHILLIDFDEFIIPNHNNSLHDLIASLDAKTKKSTGSYSFQNAFFYLQWPDDLSISKPMPPDAISSNLVTLKKTRRKSKLHPHKQRSKYICRPELIIEAGNHFVWEFIPGHGTYNVPSEAAILHHYRICEFGGDDCVKTASLIDQSAYRFKAPLIQTVRSKFNALKDSCALTPLKT